MHAVEAEGDIMVVAEGDITAVADGDIMVAVVEDTSVVAGAVLAQHEGSGTGTGDRFLGCNL